MNSAQMTFAVNWAPLERVLTAGECACFMNMGRNADVGMNHYKHVSTRRYLNIDDDGGFHKYDNGEYVPISKEAALAHVFQ